MGFRVFCCELLELGLDMFFNWIFLGGVWGVGEFESWILVLFFCFGIIRCRVLGIELSFYVGLEECGKDYVVEFNF